MKSRIIASNNECVLIYGENMGHIAEYLNKSKIKTITVSYNSAGEKIGFLAGEYGFTSSSSVKSSEGNIAVFCNFDGRKLEKLLNDMKSAGLSCVKAVMTETNKSWTLAELIKEIELERARLG